MKAKEAFTEINKKFGENQDEVKDVDGIFQFVITGVGEWVMDCKEAKIYEGTVDDPDTTLECAEEDFVAMYQGELNGMMAFTTGKLKVQGNLPLSLKIQGLLTL